MDYSENELPLLLATDLCRYYTNMVLFYQNRLYTFAYHLTGNAHDAEDILQEAFVGFALFSLLLKYLRVAPERFLLGGIEMILPIAVGVIVGNVALQDPALELQLTMPRHYDRTAIQRLFLIIGWTGCIALCANLCLSLLGLAYMPDILIS